MSESTNDQHRPWGMVVLLCLILLGVAANILLTLELREQVGSVQQAGPKRSDLPCSAIPTRLILENPACAQELLTAMNVTHVRVLAGSSEARSSQPRTSAQDQNDSSVHHLI